MEASTERSCVLDEKTDIAKIARQDSQNARDEGEDNRIRRFSSTGACRIGSAPHDGDRRRTSPSLIAPSGTRRLTLDPADRHEQDAKQDGVAQKREGPATGQQGNAAGEERGEEDGHHDPALPHGRQAPAPPVALCRKPVSAFRSHHHVFPFMRPARWLHGFLRTLKNTKNATPATTRPRRIGQGKIILANHAVSTSANPTTSRPGRPPEIGPRYGPR